MEERNTRQEKDSKGQKVESPNSSTFQTKLLSLASRAKQIKHDPLKTLIHLVDKEWLNESWKKLRKGAAYGIDAVSNEEYARNLDLNLDKLLYKMKTGKYNPLPVKKVYIPKADGKKRPLGIPAVGDKVAQNAINLIMQEVYEQEFLPMSYGFRRNKNAHQAIEDVKLTIAQKKVSWVLDVASFFDTIDHEWLLKFVKHRIADKNVIKLITQWLQAGVMEDGKLLATSSGSPQGGVISPLLANIYLHYCLDLWVTKVVHKEIKVEMYSFRYADDILFCFQHQYEASKFLKMLKERLGKFGLQFNEAKTKLCRFGRFAKENSKVYQEQGATFSFLGFTIYNGYSRTGKYRVGCRTESKRLNMAMNLVISWCKEHRHQDVSWQARYLNAVLRGHYNYYGMTGNFPSISAFYRHVQKIWHRYLSRRSQRSYIPWEKFEPIMDKYNLIKPYLPHSIYK